MPITLVQQIGNGGANPLTGVFTSNNSAGNALVFLGNILHAGAGFTISDTQNNTWVIGPQQVSPTDGTQYAVTAYCLNCKAGANTVTVTNNNSSTNMAGTFAEFTAGAGNNFTGTDGTGNAASSSATLITSSSFTTTNPNDLIIASTLIYAGSGAIVGNGYIGFDKSNYGPNQNYLVTEYQNVPPGTYAPTAGQGTSAAMFMVALALKAGGPTPPVPSTFVQCNANSLTASASQITGTFTGAETAGDTNLVYVSASVTGVIYLIQSVTDTAGNVYRIAAFPGHAMSWTAQAYLFISTGIKAAAAGNVVTVKFTQAVPTSAIQIAEYSNTPYVTAGAGNYGSGIGADPTSCTTIARGEIIVSFAQWVASGAAGIPTGNAVIRQNTASQLVLADLSVGPAGNYDLQFGVPNGNWVALTISLSNSPPPSNGRALVPPMGWDSWRFLGTSATETTVHAQANAMVSLGLPALGYTHFSVSDILYQSRVSGNLTVISAFPSGDAALFSFIRGLGLVPAQYLAPGTTGCNSFAGSQGYEATDAALITGQGADYLMYDSCTDFYNSDTTRTQYKAMQVALDATGHGVMMLASAPVYENLIFNGQQCWTAAIGANIAISSFDYLAPITWAKVVQIINDQQFLTQWIRPGRLNWGDFLPTGNGTLTDAEGRSAFAMWAMFSFPLWLSCDLTTITTATQTTITNTDIIAINQDSLVSGAVLASRTPAGSAVVDVWAKQLSGSRWAVCLFNQDAASQSITVNWSMFGASGPFNVRDLWAHSNLGSFASSYTTTVPSHDNAMILLSAPSGTLTVTTGAASSISTTGAQLNGNITQLGPGGNATVEGFNWGLTVSYGNTVSNSGSFGVSAFSDILTSLTGSTTYHFQAFATSPDGTVYGSDQTFTTAPPLTVTTSAASSIATTSAVLNGNITVLGSSGNATIEGFYWGLTTSYGATISNSGSFGVAAFSGTPTGLTGSTLYHFQAFATSPDGTAYGSDQTFTTAAPLTVSTSAASSITTTSATLNGNITGLGSSGNATIEGFQWGLTTAYGNTLSTSGSFATGVYSQSLTALATGTTYHFRAFATSPDGTAYGSDQTFTTVAALTVATNAPSNLTPTTALLNGSIVQLGPGGNATVEGFNWGLTTAYGNTLSSSGSYGVGAFSQSLTGLTKGVTYHYRAFATSPDGTVNGSDVSFVAGAVVSVSIIPVLVASGNC